MKEKIKNLMLLGGAIFLLYLAIYYWPSFSALMVTLLSAALPLVIGAMLAYVLNLVMGFYERIFFGRAKKNWQIKMRGPVCITAAILTVLAVVALIVILIVPQLVSCVQLIISKIPDVLAGLVDYAAGLNILSEDVLAYFNGINWESMVSNVMNVLTVGISGAMNTAVKIISSVFSGIVTGFLSIIFAVYILASKEKIGRQAKRAARQYLSGKWYLRLARLRRVFDDCFHSYIVGQCIEAVILGTLCAVGMMILGLPYAPMISALIAFTALIPVAGAYIGAGVGAFLILMDSPLKALIFLIFIIVLQQLEGNLIYPKVVGSSVGLPGIWVLAAVTIGGGIMGVMGMILSVPLAAAVYRLLKMDVLKREKAAEPKKEEGVAENEQA